MFGWRLASGRRRTRLRSAILTAIDLMSWMPLSESNTPSSMNCRGCLAGSTGKRMFHIAKKGTGCMFLYTGFPQKYDNKIPHDFSMTIYAVFRDAKKANTAYPSHT